MRRLIYALAAAAALAVAGLAVANSGSPQAIKTVSGTFTFTTARYTGTATSSEPSLNGAIRLHVQSAINTTRNVGTVDGTLRIPPIFSLRGCASRAWPTRSPDPPAPAATAGW